MPNEQDYKQFIRGLSQEDLGRFIFFFGGQSKRADEIIQWVNTAERETQICNKIREFFGAEIPTQAERQERTARVSADANVAAAEAAVRSADAAMRSANEAGVANNTATKALAVARWNAIWTWAAFVVALVALFVSLLK